MFIDIHRDGEHRTDQGNPCERGSSRSGENAKLNVVEEY
jgi:hypothetical protein